MMFGKWREARRAARNAVIELQEECRAALRKADAATDHDRQQRAHAMARLRSLDASLARLVTLVERTQRDPLPDAAMREHARRNGRPVGAKPLLDAIETALDGEHAEAADTPGAVAALVAEVRELRKLRHVVVHAANKLRSPLDPVERIDLCAKLAHAGSPTAGKGAS